MRAISHLRLGTKMTLLLWMTVAAMIAISAVGGFTLRQRMFDDRMEKIRAAVDSAVGIAGALEARAGAGAITREQAQDLFHRDVRAIRFDGGTGYLTVLDTRTGTLVMHGVNPALEGKPTPLDAATKQPISGAIMQSVAASDTGFAPFMYPKPGHTEPLRKVAAVARFRPWDMVFYVGAYTDDLDTAFATILFRLGAFGGSVLLLTVIGGWLVTRDITTSLGGLKSAMERLSKGDLSTVVPGTTRRDEVGGMAATVLVFRDYMAEAGQLRLAQDAMKTQAAADQVAALNRMADGFETRIGHLVGMLSSRSTALESTARSLTTAAAEGSQQATWVAAAAEEAGTGLHGVAAASEELTASISEISRQVAQSAQITGKAVDDAKRTDAIVHALADGAEKIGAVVGLISTIASQTNLLPTEERKPRTKVGLRNGLEVFTYKSTLEGA